jgi:hypothetical protein
MFRKALAALRQAFGDDSTAAADSGVVDLDSSHPPDDGRIATDGGSAESRTRSQLYAETGLEPDVYVEQLLANNGGRLRQSDIRDATRLSASTTSRLLSEMESEGQVVRIADGREKVVCLPTAAPDLVADAPSTDATA